MGAHSAQAPWGLGAGLREALGADVCCPRNAGWRLSRGTVKMWSLVHPLTNTKPPASPRWAARHLGAALCPPAAHAPCSPAGPERHCRRVAARTRAPCEQLRSGRKAGRRHAHAEQPGPWGGYWARARLDGVGSSRRAALSPTLGTEDRALVSWVSRAITPTDPRSGRPVAQARGGHSDGHTPCTRCFLGTLTCGGDVWSPPDPRPGQATLPSGSQSLHVSLLTCCAGSIGPKEPLPWLSQCPVPLPPLRAPEQALGPQPAQK